jgi:hypothetical protein
MERKLFALPSKLILPPVEECAGFIRSEVINKKLNRKESSDLITLLFNFTIKSYQKTRGPCF